MPILGLSVYELRGIYICIYIYTYMHIYTHICINTHTCYMLLYLCRILHYPAQSVQFSSVQSLSHVSVFLELSCFFEDPVDVGNLNSCSSAFSKTSLNIWKFMVHVLLKPGLENFEYYITSMWDECNCVTTFCVTSILWQCLSLGLEWKLTFSSAWNNRLVSNRKRSMSRLYIVALLI